MTTTGVSGFTENKNIEAKRYLDHALRSENEYGAMFSRF